MLGFDNFKIYLFLLNNRRNRFIIRRNSFRRIKRDKEVQNRDRNFSNFDQNFEIDSRNNFKWKHGSYRKKLISTIDNFKIQISFF